MDSKRTHGLFRHIPRLAWITLGLMLVLFTLIGGVIYGRQAPAQRYACLQVIYNQSAASPTTTFDVDTGSYFGLPTAADVQIEKNWQFVNEDISSDGQSVAYVLARVSNANSNSIVLWAKPNHAAGGVRPLFIHALDNGQDFRWIPTTHSLVYQWKQDGQATMIGITDVSTRQIKTVFLTNGNASLLGPSADGLYIAFKILAAPAQAAQVVILSTQTLQTVASIPGTPMVMGTPDGSVEAVWSPQRHRLAFLRSTTIQDAPELRIVSPGDTDLILPVHLQDFAPGIHWSPDSRYLIFESKAASNWQLAVMGTESGADFPISDKAASLDYSYPDVRWSVDQQTLYYHEHNDDGTFNLIALNLGDRTSHPLASNLLSLPYYNSDGQDALLESQSATGYRFSVIDLATGKTTLIAEGSVQDSSSTLPDAVWSPGGKMVFVELPNKIIWASADGSNLHQLAIDKPFDLQYLHWSRNGQAVVYVVGYDSVFNTLLINLVTGESHELLHDALDIPSISLAPEGKAVSIVTGDPGVSSMTMQLVSADGTQIQAYTSTQSFKNPTWSPDDSMLAYLTTDNNQTKSMTLDVVALDGSSLFHFDRFPLEYSAGGRLRWTQCN